MKVVLSTTYDDLYLFFLPIVTWSWNKLGIETITYLPAKGDPELNPVLKSMPKEILNYVRSFSASPDKLATYAQCSRLYASSINWLDPEEILITGDIDMAVFNKEYFQQLNSGQIHVVGADLVPAGQYPICYIAMPVKTWRDVMWITPGIPAQQYLDELLGHLECEHFRGNYWGKDQETVYNHIANSFLPVVKHARANAPYQFATRRADRDGWPDIVQPDLIDAHLPRPGYTEENFAKILNLFQTIYPEENFDWMVEYRNQYVKLL